MSFSSPVDLQPNIELKSLYEICKLSQSQTHLQDYFNSVMAILSDYFSIRYSALILSDWNRGSFYIEASYGIGKEAYPHDFDGQKGLIAEAFESRQPRVIQNLKQEPLYEEIMKRTKGIEKIRSPLLCFPLLTQDEPIGVININPLYGSKNEFNEDFRFLSILSSILSPVIKNSQSLKNVHPPKSVHSKENVSFLDELLEEKFSEFLNKIDPYVESKMKLGVFHELMTIVERILIKAALERMDDVQVAAAKFLGINRNTLRKKMKELKIKVR